MICSSVLRHVMMGSSPEQQQDVESHLATCKSCREELGERLGAAVQGALERVPAPGDRGWELFWQAARKGALAMPPLGAVETSSNGHSRHPTGAVANMLFPDEPPVVERTASVAVAPMARVAAVALGVGLVSLAAGYFWGSRNERIVTKTVEVIREVPARPSHAVVPAPVQHEDASLPAVVVEQARPRHGEANPLPTRPTREAKTGVAPVAEPTPSAKSAPAKPQDELESLLAGAIPAREAAPKAKAEQPASNQNVELATALTKQQIQSAMAKVQTRVHGCAEQNGVIGQGMVEVRFTIAPSGRVTAARPAGKFASTPVGNCVSEIVKSVAFPSFVGDPQPVAYVLPLR